MRKKSKDCNSWWIIEELRKITEGVYIKENQSMSQIEQLISFITMSQVIAEKMMSSWTGSITDYKT